MFNILNNQESTFVAYKSLFEYNPDATYTLLPNRQFKLYNQAAVDMLDYTREEVVGTSFERMLSAQSLEACLQSFNLALKGERQSFYSKLITKSGVEITVSILLVPIQVQGEVIGVIGVTKDISELVSLATLTHGQNRILEKIAKNHAFTDVLNDIVNLFENIFRDSHCTIMLFDKKDMKLRVGSAPKFPPKYSLLLKEIDVLFGNSPCKEAVLTKEIVICEDAENNPIWSFYRDSISEFGLKSSWAIPFFDESGDVLGTFDVYFNKTKIIQNKQKALIERASYLTGIAVQHFKAKKKISNLAYLDPLTELPNRRSFEKKVKQSFDKAQSHSLLFSLLFIDLDRFKIINDTYGHDIGDLFLVEVAKRLKSCLRETDVIARLGGDEFTILLNCSTRKDTEDISLRIIESLEIPFTINGIEIFVTPSVGISVYPEGGNSVKDLMKNADTAMYLAKKEGGNGYRFHDNLLDHKSKSRLDTENHLRKALDNNEFTLHYQPKLEMETKRIIGAECLLRWNNPVLGSVPPSTFIPIAEETGLIIPIGCWVIEAACQQIIAWKDVGITNLSVSVNLSFRQFRKPGLVKFIDDMLKRYQISPNLLEFEITESMTMDLEIATNLLQEMKDLGVSISMDDFGTGYSSFNHLKHFPLDYVKIDKSFIDDLTNNEQSEYIVNSIFLMAKAIGFQVIAEGVETKEQFDTLRKLNCDAIQGYYVSKPLPIEEFEALFCQFRSTQEDSPTIKK